MPVAKISRHCGTCTHWDAGGKPVLEGRCKTKGCSFLTFGCDDWEWDGKTPCPCCGNRVWCRGVEDDGDWTYTT